MSSCGSEGVFFLPAYLKYTFYRKVMKKVLQRRDVVLELSRSMIQISRKKSRNKLRKLLLKKSKSKKSPSQSPLLKKRMSPLSLSQRRNKRRRRWKSSKPFLEQLYPNHRQQVKVRARRRRKRRLRKVKPRPSPLRKPSKRLLLVSQLSSWLLNRRRQPSRKLSRSVLLVLSKRHLQRVPQF